MSGAVENDTVLVLGASSEGGVGWTAAQRFATRGARVVVVGRRIEPLNKLATAIGGMALACDVANEDAVVKLADELRARKVQLRAVVNAVGQVVSGTLETADIAQMHAAMATECYGNFFLFKHIAPLVMDGGAMVSISSLAATHYVPGVLPYAIAKAAGDHLVKYAAVELAPRKIRVNAILPSLIDTPMIDGIRNNAAVMKTIAKEIPLSRAAKASEIAAAAQWLCDPECFITGALIPVDGGNHLRRAPFPDEMPSDTFDALT